MIGRILGWGIILFVVVAVGLDFTGYSIPTFCWWIFLAWSLISASFAVVKGQMFVYVGKRLLEALFVIWVIATITFAMLRFLPGGPFDSEKALPEEIKANIETKYRPQ